MQVCYWGSTRRTKHAVSLVYFMMSKFLGYRKNTSSKRSEAFYKLFVPWEGCEMIVIRRNIDYLFPIGNENAFSSQPSGDFILTSKF